MPDPGRSAASGNRRGERIAWIAGATGRLGDALVEQVIASGRYRRVQVLAPRSMATTVAGFEAVDLATLTTRVAGDPGRPRGGDRCDDLYLLFDPDARRALEAAARANPTRSPGSIVFEPVTDSQTAIEIATLAARAGASRLLLLAPLQAWTQLSKANRLLPDGLELALAALPIRLVAVMKPTAETVPLAPPRPTATATGWLTRLHHRFERFSRFYLSQLRFMLPSSSVVIRSVDLARLGVDLLADPDRSGLRIVGVEWIENRLREQRGEPPRDRGSTTWRPRH